MFEESGQPFLHLEITVIGGIFAITLLEESNKGGFQEVLW